MELATLLGASGGHDIVKKVVAQPSFQKLSSDARFDLTIAQLRSPHEGSSGTEVIRDQSGQSVIRVERSTASIRLIVDLKACPGLDDHLLSLLPNIVSSYVGQ